MTLIWFVLVAALATITIVCAVGWDMERERARALRIRAEEAEAWADEYQRVAAVACKMLDQMRKRHATLAGLYGQLVQHVLTQNSGIVIAYGALKRKAGGG